RLRDALAGFALVYENYDAAQVTEGSIRSASERIQWVRRRKEAFAQATARAANLSWNEVTEPLRRLEDILYPTASTEGADGIAQPNREMQGESTFLTASLDTLQKRAAEQFARFEAEKLLDRVGTPAAPIPLETITEQLCLLVREALLKGQAGCLITDGQT